MAKVIPRSRFRLTVEVGSLLTQVSICALFDRRKTFHETFDDTQSLITGFGRGLRAKTRLQQNAGSDEKDRMISLRSWALLYLLRKLEVLLPVSREDGIAIAQLATAYNSRGLVPR